jgi:hypothetical protein
LIVELAPLPRQAKAAMTVHATVKDSHIQDKFSNIPRQLLLLCRIPFFLLMIIFDTINSIGWGGMSIFRTKVIEQFFNMSASNAAFVSGKLMTSKLTRNYCYLGGLQVPIGALGVLTGGLILRRFRLSVLQNLYFMLAISLITGGMPLLYFLRCSPPNYAGMVVGYDGSARWEKDGPVHTVDDLYSAERAH